MPGNVVYITLLMTVLTVLSLLNVFFTKTMWGLFKSWRFKNPEVVEPSDLVVWWYRVSGVLGAIFFVGLGLYAVPLMYERARCQEVVPELAKAAAQGVAGIERRARELGLEVEAEKGGSLSQYVITKDGEPFATVYERSEEGFCDM